MTLLFYPSGGRLCVRNSESLYAASPAKIGHGAYTYGLFGSIRGFINWFLGKAIWISDEKGRFLCFVQKESLVNLFSRIQFCYQNGHLHLEELHRTYIDRKNGILPSGGKYDLAFSSVLSRLHTVKLDQLSRLYFLALPA